MVRHAKEGDQYVVYSDVYGVEMRTVLNEVQVQNAKETYFSLKKELNDTVEEIEDLKAKIQEYTEDIEIIKKGVSKFNGIFDE